MLSAVCNVNYTSWMRDLIPSNTLGGFFSRRLTFATVASIVFGLGASFFVDFWKTRNPGDGEALGYSIALFVGAIFIGMARPVFMALAPEPTMHVPAAGRPSLTDNLAMPFRDRNFRQLMNFLFFRGFTTNLAIPFFAVYMLGRIGLPLSAVIKEVEVEKVVEVVKEVSYTSLPANYSVSSPSVMLGVGYPYRSSVHIPLQTKTSRDRPSNELSFGPVEKEFTVAYRILLIGDTVITDSDGNHAMIDFADVAFVNPGFADDIADPKMVNCISFMQLLGFSPLIVRNVKNLQNDTLADSERIEWRLLLNKEFNYGTDNIMSLPCQRLWSESVSPENENKRNHSSSCVAYLSQGSGIHKDVIELMKRPYTSLDASDRIQLRLVLGSDSDLSSECAMFYPQLFFGRWIPMERN